MFDLVFHHSIGLGTSHKTKWNTLQQLHTTPEAMAHNNRMKELIQNKFKHRLGPSGYKAAIPLLTKKGQELHEAGIPGPHEGCTLCMRN
jgi:hypothetical protein